MRYAPLSDLQFELEVDERVENALDGLKTLDDATIPDGLYEILKEAVYDYDFSEEVLADHYGYYLDNTGDNDV